MVTEEIIEKLVVEKIEGTSCFIVDITVAPGNKVRVLLDKDTGTSISDCMEVSRYILRNLDREVEDYQLEVMSPGLDYPISSERQYRKNISRDIKIKRVDGTTLKGKLVEVDGNGIKVFTREKERIEGRKAKQWVETEHPLAYSEIEETTVIISFK